MMSSAGVSEATTGEPSRSPSTSGRMPSGSRNASSVSSLRTTAENAPRMRSIACTAPSASVPGWCAMSAQMTSVSDVEPSRTPCSCSSARSSFVFVRLPLCPSATVRPGRWATIGCEFIQCAEPVVE